MATWQDAFAVVTKALGVISAAGSTPGIKLIPYVDDISAAATALQAGLNAAVNIAPYVLAIGDTYSGGLPTDAERAALKVKIKELEAIVDAPLPPKEEDEEE